MSRFKDAEKLAATVRDGIPSVAISWLEVVRREMEKLTTAALAGNLSDEEFRGMVQSTSARLPELLREMDHDALSSLLETGMGAAMANGIARRVEDFEERNENSAGTAAQERQMK